MDSTIEGPLLGQTVVSSPILRALPEWFGIEASILRYEQEINNLPTFLAKSDGQVLGFLSLKQHNSYSAEVYAMGVRPENHHCGIGRALVEAAEAHARGLGIEYMQVKTLGPSRADENYAKTRAFYEALGFRPLEEFTRIWDKNNPCLVLIKRL
jgi:N-acetylglutamate synthase-like GNAT family acetyltransferase